MLRLLILLSVLLMPFAMAAPPAAAMQHHAASTPMQHCPEQEPTHQTKGAFAECTMACTAALPATETPRGQPLLVACAPTEAAAAQMLHGLHPETATPPPKRS